MYIFIFVHSMQALQNFCCDIVHCKMRRVSFKLLTRSKLLLYFVGAFWFIYCFIQILPGYQGPSNIIESDIQHNTQPTVGKNPENSKDFLDFDFEESRSLNTSRLANKAKTKSNTFLNFFDYQRFEQEDKYDIQPPDTCVQAGLEVSFCIATCNSHL